MPSVMSPVRLGPLDGAGTGEGDEGVWPPPQANDTTAIAAAMAIRSGTRHCMDFV
jgi:hypothetical protein